MDAILLAYGCLALLVQRGKRIVLLYRTWKALCAAYTSAQATFCCVCCCGNGLIPCFIIQFALLCVAQFFVIILVSLRCLYDNRASPDYITTFESRILIVSGLLLPNVSMIMYILMNKVWIYELFIKTRSEKNPKYTNTRLEALTKKGFLKKLMAPFADVKAVAFSVLLVYLLGATMGSGNIPTTREVTPRINSTDPTPVPKHVLDSASEVSIVVRIILAVVLFLSNTQAALLTTYLTLIMIMMFPIVLFLILFPWLLIVCCVCIACVCSQKEGCFKLSMKVIGKFFWILWQSLIS